MTNVQRPWLWLSAIVVALSGLGWLGRRSGESFSWDVAVSAGTALGTFTLALVTWRLVASAREDARGTLELARLAEREQDARIIPFVFPITDRGWLEERAPEGESIAVRNGAPGLAINVRGQLHWPANNAEMSRGTLAGGDHATLQLGARVPSWDNVWGHVFYTDLAGREWETRFTYEQRPDGRIRALVRAYGTGLPQVAHPAGWDYPEGSPLIRLPER